LIPLKDNIPTRKPAIVTYALIAANIAVFIFFQQALFGPHGGFSSEGDHQRVIHYALIPYELTHPGKLCGERAVVLTPAGPQPVDAANAPPLCEGQTQTFTDTATGTAVPAKVQRVLDRNQPPVWVTLFTAMFMHGGVLHIAGNMLFLWIFGNNVEDAMGRIKFLLFYLAGGVVAALAQVAISPNSDVPTLGASGAIAAVLGAYAVLYPRARVVTLIFIVFFITVITVPALLVLGLWFLFQLLDASAQPLGGGGGVAYFAHIGGFLFGLLTVKLLATRHDPDYDRRTRLPGY
jgi:membrane associated rhomboid family serine protease